MQRLGYGEWFTSRVSACSLIAAAYPLASNPQKADLRQIFGALGKDETPMVRRAAAHKLGDSAQVVETNFVASELLQTFQGLTRDGEDLLLLCSILTLCMTQYAKACAGHALRHSRPQVSPQSSDGLWISFLCIP